MKQKLVIAAGVWLLAASAFAQPRAVVRSFEGPNAQKIRAAVVQGVAAAGFERVRESALESAVESSGADLSTVSGRVAVARKLQLSAIVDGEIHKKGNKIEVRVRVYNGRDGAMLGQGDFVAPKEAIAKRVQKDFGDELDYALGRAQPPEAEVAPEPEPVAAQEPAPVQRRHAQEPVAETPPEAESEPEEHAARPSALELGAAVRVLTRSYSYTDPLLSMAIHDLNPTPALRIEARWYPGSHFTNGFVANLGLDLHAQLMFPVNATKDGTDFKTTSTAFGLAARLRIPIGEHQLGVLAGYGGQSLSLADSHSVDSGVPSVAYGFVRMGGDGRFALSDQFSFGFKAAYLVLVGFGELGDAQWFSHATGGGLEAELSFGYSVSELVAFNLGGGMMRYTLSLNPEPKDTGVTKYGRIAGGATDQYFYGLAGVIFTL